MVYASPMI